MLPSSIRKSVVVGALAASVLGGWAGSANALRVIGRFDPTYGAPFTNLGWAGEATFEVDGCYFSLSTTNNAVPCGPGGLITVVDAHVDFYDTRGTVSTADDIDKGSINWAAPNLPDVLEMTFSAGNVTGVKTELFDWLFGSSAFQNIDDYEFALQFTGNSVILKNRICEIDDDDDDDHDRHDSRVAKSSRKQQSESDCDVGLNDFRRYPPILTFTTLAVPEPQTLPLIVVALAALGLAAPRRGRG